MAAHDIQPAGGPSLGARDRAGRLCQAGPAGAAGRRLSWATGAVY
ncbi:MAG TPA: hypothetical protein VGH78_01150 [Solirubrobacteraceae bacterium]